MSHSKPNWLQRVLTAGLLLKTGVLGGVLLAKMVREAHTPEITHLPLRIAGLPPAFDGLTITHISDLHFGPLVGQRYLQHALELANQLGSDLMVITGDFIYRRGPDYGGQLPKLLQNLHAPLGVYGILGNHDHHYLPGRMFALLKLTPVQLLFNQSVPLTRNGQTLYLAGVDDPRSGIAQLNQTLLGVPSDAPVILLAHAPDYALIAATDARVRLQLSGHTHGGQIVLPMLGPLPTQLPPMGQRYIRGLHRIGKLWLYVNRGLGTTNLPLRLNCPPEITQICLQVG